MGIDCATTACRRSVYTKEIIVSELSSLYFEAVAVSKNILALANNLLYLNSVL